MGVLSRNAAGMGCWRSGVWLFAAGVFTWVWLLRQGDYPKGMAFAAGGLPGVWLLRQGDYLGHGFCGRGIYRDGEGFLLGSWLPGGKKYM